MCCAAVLSVLEELQRVEGSTHIVATGLTQRRQGSTGQRQRLGRTDRLPHTHAHETRDPHFNHNTGTDANGLYTR